MPWVVQGLAVLAAGGRQREGKGERASRRMILLMTLVSLTMLVVGAAYFWLFDPASEVLREWLGARGGLRE